MGLNHTFEGRADRKAGRRDGTQDMRKSLGVGLGVHLEVEEQMVWMVAQGGCVGRYNCVESRAMRPSRP